MSLSPKDKELSNLKTQKAQILKTLSFLTKEEELAKNLSPEANPKTKSLKEIQKDIGKFQKSLDQINSQISNLTNQND